MSELPFLFAFTAGLAALVSPCGAVMLPAYVSYYLGFEEQGQSHSRVTRNIITPLKIGVVASIGLVILFASFGMFWSIVGQIINQNVPHGPLKIVWDKTKPSGDKIRLMNIDKAKKLGFMPKINI